MNKELELLVSNAEAQLPLAEKLHIMGGIILLHLADVESSKRVLKRYANDLFQTSKRIKQNFQHATTLRVPQMDSPSKEMLFQVEFSYIYQHSSIISTVAKDKINELLEFLSKEIKQNSQLRTLSGFLRGIQLVQPEKQGDKVPFSVGSNRNKLRGTVVLKARNFSVCTLSLEETGEVEYFLVEGRKGIRLPRPKKINVN